MSTSFASDNAAGISPSILEAIARANTGMAPGYGADALTQSLTKRFEDFFEHEVAVFLVATGTAANALSLATLSPPWGAVFCHAQAHIALDECGAPEFYAGGAKLVPVAGDDGKLTPEGLQVAYADFVPGTPHEVQPAAISLSQATEAGTVYRPEEIAAIGTWGRERGLRLHMDGARFANAVVATNASPAALTWQAGVDILSFGATKNGAMAAEAVVMFDTSLGADMPFRRKRAGQLFSKSRFIAAQFHAYLDNDLWRSNAQRANRAAARLAEGMAAIDGVSLAHPVEANELFVCIPDPVAARLRDQGYVFYDWPAAGPGGRRLVTNCGTSEAEVDDFLAALKSA